MLQTKEPHNWLRCYSRSAKEQADEVLKGWLTFSFFWTTMSSHIRLKHHIIAYNKRQAD